MASDLCWTRHICTVCKGFAWCDGPRYVCPWRQGEGLELCKKCLLEFTDALRELDSVEES